MMRHDTTWYDMIRGMWFLSKYKNALIVFKDRHDWIMTHWRCACWGCRSFVFCVSFIVPGLSYPHALAVSLQPVDWLSDLNNRGKLKSSKLIATQSNKMQQGQKEFRCHWHFCCETAGDLDVILATAALLANFWWDCTFPCVVLNVLLGSDGTCIWACLIQLLPLWPHAAWYRQYLQYILWREFQR